MEKIGQLSSDLVFLMRKRSLRANIITSRKCQNGSFQYSGNDRGIVIFKTMRETPAPQRECHSLFSYLEENMLQYNHIASCQNPKEQHISLQYSDFVLLTTVSKQEANQWGLESFCHANILVLMVSIMKTGSVDGTTITCNHFFKNSHNTVT